MTWESVTEIRYEKTDEKIQEKIHCPCGGNKFLHSHSGLICEVCGRNKADRSEYTGGRVSYYTIDVKNPTSGGKAYTVECNDVIEALGMTFAEGNAFKAIWRLCAARNGKAKAGYRDGLYDAEKVVFFGQRMVEAAKR